MFIRIRINSRTQKKKFCLRFLDCPRLGVLYLAGVEFDNILCASRNHQKGITKLVSILICTW